MERVYIDENYGAFYDLDALFRYLKSISRYDSLIEGMEKLFRNREAELQEELAEREEIYSEANELAEELRQMTMELDGAKAAFDEINYTICEIEQDMQDGSIRPSRKLKAHIEEIRRYL